MIQIDNLGYHTDCIARKLEGEFLAREWYFVLRMPMNPTYYWGNLLIFRNEPQSDDFERWMSAHVAEFGEHSGHVTFGWESQKVGDIDRFIQNGFGLESTCVLVFDERRRSQAPLDALSIRQISGKSDWEAVLQLQLLVSAGSVPSKEYVEFKTREFESYRRLSGVGAGSWWGAFIGDKLVGDMGLYFDDQFNNGRFQSVETHPDYRGIGVCSQLLPYVANHALDAHPHSKLVICAEQGSAAERLYRKLGFERCQLQHGVCLPRPFGEIVQ